LRLRSESGAERRGKHQTFELHLASD